MKIKRIAALLMTVLICFVPLLSVDAAAETNSTFVPTIYVPGFMATTLYSGLGTDEQKSLFPPDADELKYTIALAMPSIVHFAATRDWDALLDAAVPLMNGLLGDAFTDSDGNNKEGTGIDWTYPTCETVRYADETTFRYDWRLSPTEIAQQLKDYIEYVKICAESDRVNLVCHSYGNCVGMAYIAMYGTESLSGFVCNASAFLGESFNGELMTGQLNINGNALCSYLKDNVFKGTDYEEVGNSICDILDLLFVVDAVEDNANYVFEKVQQRAAKEILLQWFGKWPCIWAMVPDEYYAQAREYVFGDMLKDEDCSGLLAILDNYDKIVREHRYEILDKAAADLRFGVIAKYNCQKIPITSNPNALGDNNVDTKYASIGAVTAEYGSTLPKDYVQAKHSDTNYISPDRMIDASTCRYPERTWFIKNMGHSVNCSKLDELISAILNRDNFTVTSSEEFSQFMIYDNENDTIVSLNSATEQKADISSKIFGLFRRLKALIIDLLRTLGII